MIEFFKAIKIIGVKSLFRIYFAERYGWGGIISGYFTTRTIQALFNIGFFDEMKLKGKVNLKEFSKKENIEENILRTLCESLYALKILNQSHDSYFLSPKGRLLTETARGWFYGTYGYEEIYHFLEDLLRKEKRYGEDIYRRSDAVALGSGEAEDLIYFPIAADIIQKKGYKRVLDLGCGDGTFLRKLLFYVEGVHGYGIDIDPEMIAHGEEKLCHEGLQSRIHLYVQDITKIKELPPTLQAINVATIFLALHEILYEGENAVIRFLKSYKRLFPEVPLIVFEVIPVSPEKLRRRPGMGVQYFLQHELSHQKLVGRVEWIELFEKAGFESIRERYLRFARTSIFTLS